MADNTQANDGAAAADAAAKKGPGKKGKVLIVRASVPRFRRAGLEFGREDRRVPLADLTAEQVKALKDEPLLSVRDGGTDE